MRKCVLCFLVFVFCPLLVAQQALNNSAVEKMVKAGLSDNVIIETVNASPGAYDTSANGLIALRKAGVSDKVLSAIILKASGKSPSSDASTPTAMPRLPQGISDVGVYYKDKNGAWKELMPEIVNFKSGGVLKSFVSGGIVKGDVNGHMRGAHAKLQLTFPVEIAVYPPEGTEITEYQLLRLRENGRSREFRSVTGGVLHVSGGSTRDDLSYQPKKIAPRVYEIELDAKEGKGEYGLLPPGALGTANMGSSGKIYAFGVKE